MHFGLTRISRYIQPQNYPRLGHFYENFIIFVTSLSVKVDAYMKNFLKIFSSWGLAATLVCILTFIINGTDCHAQRRNRQNAENTELSVQTAPRVDSTGKRLVYLHYKIIDGDTVYVETLRPSRCYSRLPRQKGKMLLETPKTKGKRMAQILSPCTQLRQNISLRACF